MFRTFIRKELLENLLSQRFSVALALAAVICWSSTMVLTRNFNESSAEFHRRDALKTRMTDQFFFANGAGGLIVRPIKPPPVLSSLARGVPHDLIIMGSIDENPVPVLFPFMDILVVIGLIMSVAALALSYDRISGERENGTLKLLVMGSYPRSRIILAKWFGGILSLLAILGISFAGSVLIAYTLSESYWTTTEWSALGLLLLLSGLYCASFYSVGLYVSAKTERPSDSIIVALLLWMLFTLILPTIPPYVASILYPTPSASRTQYQIVFALEEKRRDAVNSLRAPFRAQGLKEEEIVARTKPEEEKITAAYQEEKKALENATLEKSAIHEAITGVLHALSPFSCYTLAGAELTATGAMNQLYFTKKAGEYENAFFAEYLPRKEKEARERDPSYTGSMRLDVSDRPKFQFTDEGIGYRLAASATHTVFILIYTALFFLLAWKAFLRYDVR